MRLEMLVYTAFSYNAQRVNLFESTLDKKLA
jgi:hypothetical protein